MTADHRETIGGVLGLVAALLVLTACSDDGGGVSGEAACAAPQTTAMPASVRPGDVLGIQALNLWSKCADTGDGDSGHALRDQAVVWSQSGQEIVLGHLDADPGTGKADAKLTVPAQAEAGRAQIRIGETLSAKVTVRASEAPATDP